MKTIGALFLLLIVPAFADQSVTLAWDPNPESDISSYVIYYGNGSRNYRSNTNVGNVTTATVYGLKEGFPWFFAITAKNTSGLESDFSNEVTNRIPDTATNYVPRIDALNDVSLRQDTETNISVTIWDVETPPGELTVTASSTNALLLPSDRISITGIGYRREINLRPSPGRTGETLVTVIVSDGSKAASTAFLLTVLPVPEIPRRVFFISNLQSAPTRTGPWSNILTTILPVVIDPLSTERFYQTRMSVQPDG